ncbi:MAG: protoporphyrinogen oxidase [Candidatus Caenarcaniphilales bacterium]|nr:protoporphyrinogen oxidase [Candidatus Caenarcaniphilales bacterium]
MTSLKDLVIIGGGISGLSAAFHAERNNLDFVLLEASNRFGGAVFTSSMDNGYLCERGPGSLVIGNCLSEIINRVQLKPLKASPKAKHKLVFSDCTLHQITRPFYIFLSNFLSTETKLSFFKDFFSFRQTDKQSSLNSNKDDKDESVKSFFESRFNEEFVNKLIWPVLSGIYAGNPAQLSIRTVWPKIYELDKKYQSISRGMLFSLLKKGKKENREIYSFESGLNELINGIVQYLPSERLKLNSQITLVEECSSLEKGYKYFLHSNSGEKILAKRVIIATPSYVAASLMPLRLSELQKITYSPLVTVNCWMNKSLMRESNQKLVEESFGFLSSKNEDIKTLGVIFNSSLFPKRAPDECFSFTIFLGGSNFPELISLSDNQIKDICIEDINKAFNLTGKLEHKDLKVKLISRWKKAVPQLSLGHHNLIQSTLENLPNDIAIAGNYIKGVSIENAAQSGLDAIKKLIP